MRHAEKVKARVMIELPACCGYWRWLRVVKLLRHYGFMFANFDGCVYGLTTSAGGPTAAGGIAQPVKKPWRIACLRSTIPLVLTEKCDGSHTHAPCGGRITCGTQGYTQNLSWCILHVVLMRHGAHNLPVFVWHADHGTISVIVHPFTLFVAVLVVPSACPPRPSMYLSLSALQ